MQVLVLLQYANLFFNTPSGFLGYLKRTWTQGAILYSAFHAIAGFRNKSMKIGINGGKYLTYNVTNLGIVKNPNFSGNFCYDSLYEPGSGLFNIHLCEDMTLPSTLAILWRLSRKNFSGNTNTVSWKSNKITIEADNKFAVEFDGEIITTNSVSFSIKPKCIQICS